MKTIDATMMIRRDGNWWLETHWMETTSIDDPIPDYRVVDIRDGSDELAPVICYVMPNRPMPINQEGDE